MRMMFDFRKEMVLRFFLGFATLPVAAAVFTANPVADAFVTTGPAGNLSGTNYGGGGALALSAPGLTSGEFQSVLRFDTSGAKTLFDGLYGAGLWSLQAVTLQLSAGTPNNAIFNANSAGSFGVNWMQNDSWVEGTGTPSLPGATGITYNTLQSTYLNPSADEALGAFSYNGAGSGAFLYSLNRPAAFSADILAGNLVSLRLAAADNTVSYLFNSRSFGTVANRPLLTLTAAAVPEPGAVPLLTIGILLFAARKPQRH